MTGIENINPRTGKELKEGDLRVWFNVNLQHTFYIYTVDINEAKRVIEHEAKRQLSDERIHMNAFGLQEYGVIDVEPEWTEWYDPEYGYDIHEYELSGNE